jgi:hypothetical protein
MKTRLGRQESAMLVYLQLRKKRTVRAGELTGPLGQRTRASACTLGLAVSGPLTMSVEPRRTSGVYRTEGRSWPPKLAHRGRGSTAAGKLKQGTL